MVAEPERIEPRDEPTRIGGIDYPDEVIRALLERRLVVFAGAGVSMACPSHLPNFDGLIKEFEHQTGRCRLDGESYDQYLGRNDIEHGVNVHGVVKRRLNQGVPRPNANHMNLLRLFGSADDVRLVTTNFDHMFEQACGPLGWSIESFVAPLLPTATDFKGIVHLHGSLEDHERMVLTDTDLGRAYLSEGWASRFLSELVRRYTVLFVGYSSRDLMPRYLLSAIRDASAGKLYMLHPSGEEQIARQIGIHPIPYGPDSTVDHSVLTASVARLGTLFSQDLDEWRLTIESTVTRANPIEHSDEEVIRIALRAPSTTRYFVNAADGISWVEWLGENGYLTSVFTAGEQPQSVQFLSHLVARQCIRDDPAYLLSLIERHRFVMSDHLWQELVFAIRENEMSEVSLAQWLTILLQQPIEHMDGFGLSVLADVCADRGDAEALLILYKFLVKPRWDGSPPGWSGFDEYVKITEDTVDQSGGSLALHHCANMLDTQDASILKEALEIGIRSFERRHKLLQVWGKSTDDYDPWSTVYDPMNRPDDQGEPEGFDLLCLVTRQQIHSVINSGDDYADDLVRRLVTSSAPILRRLAVDAVRVREDMDAETKAEWLMEQSRVVDRELVSEVSRLLEQVFRGLSADTQSRLVDWLMSGEECQTRQADDVLRSKARWIKLLDSANPNSHAVAREIENLKRQDPDVLANRYPERDFGIIEAGRIDHPKPFTVEELLSKRAADWLEELTAWRYPGQWLWSEERLGLQNTVKLACEQDFDWSLELATQLADMCETVSDLWVPLFQAWCSEGASVSDWTSVLRLAMELVERDDTSVEIAHMLTKFAREGTKIDDFEIAGGLATMLWRVHDSNVERFNYDYVVASLNTVAGRVPEYWALLAHRVVASELPQPVFVPDGMQWLSRLARSSSEAAAVAKVTVGCRLDVFLQLDREWATTDLLPMFGACDLGFACAWEGFLLSFRHTGWIPDELFAFIGHALRNRARIHARFTGNMTHLVAFLCCNRIDTDNDEFVRTIFDTSKDTDHLKRDIHDFTSGLRTCMQAADAERQKIIWDSWLKEYLSGRRNGLPAGLVEGEVWQLLRIIPIMLPAVREIVDVLINFPVDRSARNNFGSIFHKVDVEDFPKEYAKLMLYFDQYELDHWQWDLNKEHVNKLIANEAVPLDQRKQLQELKLKHMID